MWQLFTAIAVADDPPSVVAGDPNDPVSGDFGTALTAAKQFFFRGQHVEAQRRLSALNVRLLKGEAVPVELRNDCRAWLGEVLFRLEQTDEARSVFRQLLEEDSSWPIDEYQHSVEVVAVFYDVRRQVVAEQEQTQPTSPAASPRVPAWTLLPFGIAQFIDQRPAAGTTHLAVQLAFATTSVIAFAELKRTNVSDIGHPEGWTTVQIARNQQVQRWAVQWPATALFYGSAVVGILEARGSYRKHRSSIGVALLATEYGGGLRIVGTTDRD